MSDPQRLRVDDPVVGALLDAARDYSVPTEMRRRLLGSLGLPAASASAAPAVAGSSKAGLLSGPLAKTLMTLAALATVGGGLAGYQSWRSREVTAAGRTAMPAPRTMLAGEPAVVPRAADHRPTAAAARDTAALAAASAMVSVAAAEPRRAPSGPVAGPAAGRRSMTATHRAAVIPAAPPVSAGATAPAAATPPSPVVGATGIVRTPPAAVELPPALADEIALLDQAEASVRRQAYKRALAQLEEHDRRFPDGVLTQEASVLSIAARFGIGDREGAEMRARQFLARHGDGILSVRVRSMIAAAAR